MIDIPARPGRAKSQPPGGARRRARRARAWFVAGGLALAVAVSPKDTESLGTALEIALPLVGAGCAVANGALPEYAARYVVQLVAVHGPKHALGDAPINARPRGGYQGMPSGHTATAAFGASYIVHACVRRAPVVQGLTVIAAGFVGTSRVAVGAHDIWQVLIGALVGWASDRAFRRHTRRRFPRWPRRRGGASALRHRGGE